jgi:RNA polymerase sigma factor (sigma-70 family)
MTTSVAQDLAVSADFAASEHSAGPEDVAAWEDGADPEDVAAWEDRAVSEDVAAPEHVAVPVEVAAPEDGAISEDVADFDLIRRWRTGDSRAGQALFARHFADIRRFFQAKCAPEADDLAQATFFACLRAKDRFRGDASFRTYLFTIARHELYRAERERRRADHRLDLARTATATLEPEVVIEHAVGHGDDHQRLVGLLHQLPSEHRTLLELHYWEELEIAALVQRFGSPAVTIRGRLHRARKLLRELVESDGRPAKRRRRLTRSRRAHATATAPGTATVTVM